MTCGKPRTRRLSAQIGKLTCRVAPRKPTLKYGLPSRVVSSSLAVISRKMSASCPFSSSSSATIVAVLVAMRFALVRNARPQTSSIVKHGAMVGNQMLRNWHLG